MDRRAFLTSLGLAAAGSQLACASVAQNVATGRRLRRVGIQLYTLRDDAKRDLERTLADIAGAGYKDVELLSSMNNFGMPPARLRQVLDQNGLRAPSTHVGVGELNDLDRQLADAATLGHKYIVLASLPGNERTLDDYKRWADRLNELGRRSLTHVVWHDTGNMAMGGRDPLEYMKRIGKRYWLFHIKDAPSLGASTDAELGKGIVDFKRILASIDDIDDKLLYVEQETYPGAPLDSARRDYAYITGLTF